MTKGEKLGLIRELYESGSSIEAIAEVTGYKVKSVNQMLSQIGIYRGHSKIKNYEKIIIKMRKEGAKLSEISNLTGFSITTISKFLKRNGYGKYCITKPEKKDEEKFENKFIYAEHPKETIERFYINGIRYVTVPFEDIFGN